MMLLLYSVPLILMWNSMSSLALPLAQAEALLTMLRAPLHDPSTAGAVVSLPVPVHQPQAPVTAPVTSYTPGSGCCPQQANVIVNVQHAGPPCNGKPCEPLPDIHPPVVQTAENPAQEDVNRNWRVMLAYLALPPTAVFADLPAVYQEHWRQYMNDKRFEQGEKPDQPLLQQVVGTEDPLTRLKLPS